jgi:hypothetical protein
MSRALTLVAGAVTGLAAWTTLGVLAVLPTAPGVSPSGVLRAGVLPSAFFAIAFILAFCVAFVFRPRLRATAGILALILLPWLPLDLPAAALLWTGPLVWAIWTAWLTATLVYAGVRLPAWAATWVSEPRRATRVAFALAAIAYVAGLALAARTVPGGDEPHYLIIARSLLADGDLRIENNHAQRDYLPYFEGELKPDFLKRSVDGAIYSIHAPGLPVLIAPALALFGHRGAMVFLALVSAFGTSLAWRLAWQVSGSVAAAWFGWAAIAFAAPFFVHAFTVYPDAPAGVIVVVGLLAFVRESTAGSREPDAEPARLSIGLGIAGLALAALPWFHTRYALLAGALGVAIGGRLLVARRMREAAVFLAAPAVSAAGWFLFFQMIYGTPSPAAPYGGYTQAALAFVLPGLTGLLADQQFGLIATAPVLVFAVAGVGAMVFARADVPRARELRLLGLVLLLVCAPYALAASSYRMWWGGFSGPARFLVPLVPALAAPLAVLFARARTNTTRALAIWSLVWTIGFAWILVAEEGGRLAFTTRTPTAAWAMRLAPSVDLAGALPGFFRGPLSAMWGLIAVWAGVATCVWLALRELERRTGLTLQRLVAVWAPLVMGVGAMAALTVAWRLDRRSPLRPVASQAALASHVPAMAPPPRSAVVFEPAPWPFLKVGVSRPDVVVSLLRLSNETRAGATPDEPVLTTPPLPAASWRLRLSPRHPPGEMQVFVSRSATPIVTLDRTAFQPGAGGGFEATFDIGAAVEGLVIRGWPNPFLPGDVTLALTTLQDDPAGGAVRAVRAAKYGAVAVFFADEKVFPEATGFWVKGGAEATIALSAPTPDVRLELQLRNTPKANRISVSRGDWRESIALAPGEERRVALPPNRVGSRAATVIRIHPEIGVRPADLEPANGDLRLLGVWVEVREPRS